MMKETAATTPRSSPRRELLVLLGSAVLTTVAFGILTLAVWRTNAPVGFDRLAARTGIEAGEDGPLGGQPRLARAAEQLGSRRGVGSLAAVVLGAALLWRERVMALVAVSAPLACFLLTEYVAKPAINEPIPFGGRTYPSGHTAGIAAVALVAVILVRRHTGGVGLVLSAALGLGTVLVVGLAVLALRFHHYPSDVAGGALLAGSVVFSLTGLAVVGEAWLTPRRGEG